ncbi:Uncharacterized protein TCM_004050 [Theobroma cacao]|uniref:Uncharacterized protein n=1 Tax=Theobroma cacao TaxID=3641 RepID=A0A061DQT2_THECC|nr:Uncharacterized protein TCM_004050 [Theobroma cacao]
MTEPTKIARSPLRKVPCISLNMSYNDPNPNTETQRAQHAFPQASRCHCYIRTVDPTFASGTFVQVGSNFPTKAE